MNPVTFLLDALYPSFCYQCKQLIGSNDAFCSECTKEITPIVSLILPLTTHYKLTVFAASAYKDPIKKLITRKFSYDILASHHLARLILELTPMKNRNIDYILPVPLHWTRYAWRGFNQAHEMAHVIGKALNIKVLPALSRTKKTRYQSLCSRTKRHENVKNAFIISRHYQEQAADLFKDKHIVLVDDLCTTGSTLIQAAKIIAPFQPASLSAFVACRAI